MEANSASVFKSYLRMLLLQLKDLQEADEEDDREKVKKKLKKLIEDTQSGIEDG